jgi:phage gpG-like protein
MDITVDDEAVARDLDQMLHKAEDTTIPLTETGKILVESAQQNIDEGGRPTHWDPPVSPQDHPLLKKTGDLYSSINYIVLGDEVSVGDSMEYAVFQDAHRPFMFAQPEDQERIENLIVKHITP